MLDISPMRKKYHQKPVRKNPKDIINIVDDLIYRQLFNPNLNRTHYAEVVNLLLKEVGGYFYNQLNVGNPKGRLTVSPFIEHTVSVTQLVHKTIPITKSILGCHICYSDNVNRATEFRYECDLESTRFDSNYFTTKILESHHQTKTELVKQEKLRYNEVMANRLYLAYGKNVRVNVSHLFLDKKSELKLLIMPTISL